MRKPTNSLPPRPCGYAVNKTVLRLPRDVVEQGSLPPTLAETLPHLPELKQARSFAVVCSGISCQPPVYEAEEVD